MKTVVIPCVDISFSSELIEKVVNRSEGDMSRARIFFKNGHQLSVIRGADSYGGDKGLFEIAPFTKEGEMSGDLLDPEDGGDDVCGYLTAERVNYYINKIGSL